MIRRCGVAVALALVATLGLSVATASAAEEFYGVNLGGEVWNLPAAERDSHLAQIKAIGIDTVRLDASWSGVEPAAPVGGVHSWKWEGTDRIATAFARHGLRWYPMLGYATTWSTAVPGNIFSGPADPAAYGAFVRAFAERYGVGGSFWAANPELRQLPVMNYELWNEPNYDRFWSNQNGAPAAFADTYLAGRNAIHAVDASARAVLGGLIDPDQEQFLTAMLAARPALRGQIDAVGYHPYQAASTAAVVQSTASLRTAMTRGGLAISVPIELTEIGWHDKAWDEADRARMMRTSARAVRRADLNVTRFMPYVWAGGDWSLWGMDGTPRAPGSAYRAAIAATAGPQQQALGQVTSRSGSRKTRKRVPRSRGTTR